MKFPNIKEKVLKIYTEEFLKLNNLNIGDELEVNFTYHKLHPKYKSSKMERVSHNKKAIGTLKEDENGLYVESNNKFQFYELTSNGLTGRQRREWYKSIMKQSIFKIRGGLSF